MTKKIIRFLLSLFAISFRLFCSIFYFLYRVITLSLESEDFIVLFLLALGLVCCWYLSIHVNVNVGFGSFSFSISALVPVSLPRSMRFLNDDWFLKSIASKETLFDRLSLLKDKFYDLNYPRDRVSFTHGSDGFDTNTINLMGLEFKYDVMYDRYVLIERVFDAVELLCVGEAIFSYMNSINKFGFITKNSLDDCFINHFGRHLEMFNFEPKILGNSELPYTMWHNFIFINIYYLIIQCLKTCKQDGFSKLHYLDLSEDDEVEVLDDLEDLRARFWGKLDQYVKAQLQRRGISVIENSYAGFDSEYEFDTGFKNDLISVQTAVQRRTIIKVPMYHSFDISYVNPLTSEFSNIFVNKVDNGGSYLYSFRDEPTSEVKPINDGDEEYDDDLKKKKRKAKINEIFLLNSSLKFAIGKVRCIVLEGVVELSNSLVLCLRDLLKLPEFKRAGCFDDFKRDQFVFYFPLTPLKTEILYPSDQKFSFSELLDITKNSSDLWFESQSFLPYFSNTTPSFTNNKLFNTFRGGGVEQTFEPFQGFDCNSNDMDVENINVENINININVDGGKLDERVSVNVLSLQDIECNTNELDDKELHCDLEVSANEHSDLVSNDNSLEVTHPLTPPLTAVIGETEDLNLNQPVVGFSLRDNFIFILKLFQSCGLSTEPLKLLEWYGKNSDKPRCRTKTFYNDNIKIHLTLVKNLYIVAHYNAADLSMLSDFEELKIKLSIVNKSFVSLGKPLRYDHSFVYVRDTMLIAPAGAGSLEKLGKIYESEGDFSKRKISQEDISNMKAFLKRDKSAFEEYALQDAVITLKHATAMEEFNMRVNQIGIPLTLSSIGRKYVFKEWSKIFRKYLPYQISGDFLMGNADEVQTPKGLFASRDVGAHMSYFIANYKGGRNESFMYGSENQTHWVDYDLTSAYTTGMAALTLPDYYNGSLITPSELEEWSPEQFLRGYLIVNADFEFPKSVKYPSIPCYIDKTTTVYPLTGSCFVTGPEYWLALRQGCKFSIKSAFYIQPKEKTKFNNITKEKEVYPMKPFHAIIKDVQSKRREHPKGTVLNMLYKEMGNGIYGNVVRGMSNKKNFDSLTKQNIRVTATELSNPILASWTTAFIRSVIGECLHNIQTLGGKVVSVTTDGFITNITDLESKLLTLPENDTMLLRKYRTLRQDLTTFEEDTSKTPNPDALEIKSEGKGMISWTTRGQLGIEGKMVAATGFQRAGYEKDELVTMFKNILKSKDKFCEFTRFSLRSAKDIFEKGGNVVPILKDQTFRLFHDNRRQIEGYNKLNGSVDLSRRLLDSKPLQDIKNCKTMRFLSKFPITNPFNKNNANKASTGYKSSLEVGVRNFIKGYYSKNEKFGLKGTEFKNSTDIISFINGITPTKDLKISKHSISKLKNRKLIWYPVKPTKENLTFIAKVKESYPYFNDQLFFKKET